MCSTCAQSHDALLPTKLQAVSWGPTVINFVPSEGSPYNDSIEKGASPGDHWAHPNSASFWKGPVQLHCPYGAASATVWQSFQRQVLIHFCWLSSNIHSLWFWFLSSPPQIAFFPQTWLTCPFAVYIPGMFHSKLQQQKATFSLFFLPPLFAIFSAKLGVQNVPYFESSENSTHIFSICICSVIISRYVSSVLVKLVMQQQHETSVQGAESAS